MFYEKLIEIGFTENEAKIYLELLKIGPQACSVIAQRISMNRSTVYSIIKSLIKKGVLGTYKNGNIKHYTAKDPNCLIGYLDRKCRLFDYYRSEFLEIVPTIRGIKEKYSHTKPTVSYFEGKEATQQMLDEARSYSGELFSCFRDKKGNIVLNKSKTVDFNRCNNVINVYDDKISYINIKKGSEYGIVLKSKEIAEIHKIIFNVARNGFKIENNESKS